MPPDLRDARGAVATPTTDSMRTRLRPDNALLYFNINGDGGGVDLEEAIEYSTSLLSRWAAATDLAVQRIQP